MSVVYFLRLALGGPVKIGLTSDLETRLLSLQCASATPIEVLRVISGDRLTELWLHRHFSHLRVRGEWFRFEANMLTVVPPDRSQMKAEMPKRSVQPRDNYNVDRVEKWTLAAVSFFKSQAAADPIAAAAGVLGIKRRRVLAILHGELSRIWADESDQIRDWYLQWATAERARLDATSSRLGSEIDELNSEIASRAELIQMLQGVTR